MTMFSRCLAVSALVLPFIATPANADEPRPSILPMSRRPSQAGGIIDCGIWTISILPPKPILMRWSDGMAHEGSSMY